METGEGAAMLSLEERVQRMEKLAKSTKELARRVKRMERLACKKKHARRLVEELALRVKRKKRHAMRKKKHAMRLAEERAKMELRATKQFAEEEDNVKMELQATEDEEFTKMEDRIKKWQAKAEMDMRIVREAIEWRTKLMGKPVADAGSEEGKPLSEAGSKQGKRKRTRMVRLNQARVERMVPMMRRPPYPGRMPDWMLALVPEEMRKEELEKRAVFDEIEAFTEDIYKQYILKRFVEVEVTEEVTDDDEPEVQE